MRADTTLRTLETSTFIPVFISIYFYKACIHRRLRRRGRWPGLEVVGLGGILWSFLSLPSGCSLQLSEETSKRGIDTYRDWGAFKRGDWYLISSYAVYHYSGLADLTPAFLSALKTLHLPKIEASLDFL